MSATETPDFVTPKHRALPTRLRRSSRGAAAVWLGKELPEEEEEAPAQDLHVRAPPDELLEELQDVWDVGEGQHEQSLLQLTERENANTGSRPGSATSTPSTGASSPHATEFTHAGRHGHASVFQAGPPFRFCSVYLVL